MHKPTATKTPLHRTQLGRHKGGRELLAAVGFCDELRAEAGQRDITRSLSPSKRSKGAVSGGAGAAAVAAGASITAKASILLNLLGSRQSGLNYVTCGIIKPYNGTVRQYDLASCVCVSEMLALCCSSGTPATSNTGLVRVNDPLVVIMCFRYIFPVKCERGEGGRVACYFDKSFLHLRF